MRYQMEDGTIVETKNAKQAWDEATFHDGRNIISRATGDQWHHQKLYRSAKGRYYVENWSQWQGSRPSACWLNNNEAAAWLVLNEHEIPDDLAAAAAEITE